MALSVGNWGYNIFTSLGGCFKHFLVLLYLGKISHLTCWCFLVGSEEV